MFATQPHLVTGLERRSNHPTEWVPSLCQEFSAATGWTLGFWELPQHASADLSQLNWCWHSDVSDGEQRLGTVFLESPVDSQPALSFQAAYRLAELSTAQLNRCLRLQRLNQMQAREIGALVDPDHAAQDGEFVSRLRALLRATVTLTSYRSAALFVLNPDGGGVRVRFVHQLPAANVPRAHRAFAESPPDFEALQSGLCLVRRGESETSGDWLPRDAAIGLCVGVRNDSGPIGTMWLFDRRQRETDEKELRLLRGFGRQIADAFERLVLLRDSETKERLTRELDLIASTIQNDCQQSLLLPGCDVAMRCCSRCEVGGDLCESIPIDEFRTAFLVGDASGDSIPANVVMTATRGAVHAVLARHGADLPPLDEVMQILNRAISRVTSTQQFITLVLGVYDSRTRTFSYTNAGHPPPLLVHAGEVQALKSLGVVLGVIDSATYGVEDVTLEPNDVLVLFSDGIIEARCRNRTMFRTDGIRQCLGDITGDSAREVLDAIWSRYEAHTNGTSSDDRTLLVIRAT